VSVPPASDASTNAGVFWRLLGPRSPSPESLAVVQSLARSMDRPLLPVMLLPRIATQFPGPSKVMPVVLETIVLPLMVVVPTSAPRKMPVVLPMEAVPAASVPM